MREPYSFWYSSAGLVVGTVFLILSVVLIWRGEKSQTKWLLTAGHFRLEISTTTSGVILATLGLLVIYITRYGSG